MKNRLISTTIILSAVCLMATAQTSVLSFGLRGGALALMEKSEAEVASKMGPLVGFDLGYLYYAEAGKVEIGLRTGLSAGYGQNSLAGTFSHEFSNTDYEGDAVAYTTSGSLQQKQQMLIGKLPVMLAFRAKGFTLNAGVSLQTALWQKGSQTLADAKVDAYYQQTDVHVVDELITGRVDADQLVQSGKFGAPSLSVGVGTEIGYEFNVGDKSVFGIQAFVDYSVWNNYKPALGPVIGVAPIADAQNPVPAVTVQPATQALVSKMNPMEVGLKLYAGLEFKK